MSEEMMSPGQRKKLFALLGEAGIKNREDRLSFARTVLDLSDQDLSSFTELYAHEADDLILAINGWKIAEELRNLNGNTLRSSISFVRRYYNYAHDSDAVEHVQNDGDTEDGAGDAQAPQEEDKTSPAVRRPRRSGKPSKAAENVDDNEADTDEEPPKKSVARKRSSTRPASADQSRSHTGRSSKSRSGSDRSFSSDEIGYNLDD